MRLFLRYGKEFSQTRTYKSKSKGAQEAHEAIRPTYISEKILKENLLIKNCMI